MSNKVTPSSSPHYKLNIRPSTKCTPLSYNSPSLHKDKTKLFEGLDDSVSGNDTFIPRTHLKKLVLKTRPYPSPNPLPDSTSPPHTRPLSPVATSVTMTTAANSIPAFSVTPRSTPHSVTGPTQTSPYNNPIIKPTPM